MSEIGKSEIGIPPIPDSHANGRIRHRQLRAVLTWCRLMVDKMTRMAPDLGMPTLWPLFSMTNSVSINSFRQQMGNQMERRNVWRCCKFNGWTSRPLIVQVCATNSLQRKRNHFLLLLQLNMATRRLAT
uniref:Uncharacterized protein n=1 Tax=Globodera rostochiensis TaxID=31243 RepID=A0A914H6E9_GLORO